MEHPLLLLMCVMVTLHPAGVLDWMVVKK